MVVAIQQRILSGVAQCKTASRFFPASRKSKKGNFMKPISIPLKIVLLVSTAIFSTALASASDFDWENLQSDIHGVGEITDANVVDPWGIARSNSETIFIVNNGTGTATEYFQNGTPVPDFGDPHVIVIPRSVVNMEGANPTGTVWNNTSFFRVRNGVSSAPAKLIFVSEDGVISGWNPNLNNTRAFKASDHGSTGAVYKGVTMGVFNNHNFLYVTNFHSGKVETYDENFMRILQFPFTDANIPTGYAPFGIRNFDGNVVVTYAKQDAEREDDVPCSGCGFIDVFNTQGHLLRRLVSNGHLNAPWGLEIVNGQLWVGNFGNGRINVYDPANGSFIGEPKDIYHIPLQLDGLWGLLRIDGSVYFTAGIVDEKHGIFGVIFNN
jgi:uncharacterized protein (TIGR03118 family)